MSVVEPYILSYLFNSLWQVTLLFGAGWLAARSVRRVGPAAEHRVWVTVLVLQGLLPAVSLLPWEHASWQWLRALLPMTRTGGTGEGHISVVMGAATGIGGLRLPGTFFSVIAITYIAAMVYFFARFCWRARALSVLRREAVEIPLTGEAAHFWLRCARLSGIRHVSLAASSRVSGPVTLGYTRKLVLLPATMVGSLPDEDFGTVIAHECAHMRRNDFIKNLLYELVSLPVAYHPLLWLAQERVTESREMVCDHMAADLSGRTEYARSLLRLASLLVHGSPARIPHAIGIFDAHTFERRLMKLTDGTKEVRGLRRVAVIAGCVALAAMTCGSALALRMDVSAPVGASRSIQSMEAGKTPKKVVIASGVMAGNKLSGDDPKYPVKAKKAKIQGTVVLEAEISKVGEIEHLRVVSGPKELQTSALNAVKTWKYKPYMLNGEVIDVTTTINVTYQLGG